MSSEKLSEIRKFLVPTGKPRPEWGRLVRTPIGIKRFKGLKGLKGAGKKVKEDDRET